MSFKKISTPLAVVATLLIIVFVMLIAMTATTEADIGLQPTTKEQTGMNEYYANCPFKKAEIADISSQDSIRDQVRFTDVSCDPGKHLEQVTVELLGENKDQTKTVFETWLKSKGLEEGEQLKISFN